MRANIVNFFEIHKDVFDIISLKQPLYTEYKENIGTNSHPRINVTVTYTFGYGKKAQRGNEVGEQYGSNSAIMK